MPYVDGFGTWPFGEEWLWEAIATSYVPLLDVLGRAPITLSLTPVLCDQLEAPGALERCLTFLREIRPESHVRDIRGFRAHGEEALARELERSAAEYASAADRLERLPGGVGAALGEHAGWTSSATHAILPLLATDSGISLQIQTGIASHRRRFGEWGGGFWLPECAHAPWLDSLLEDAGVRASCVELTRPVRPRRPPPSAATGDARGTGAVADRSTGDGAGLERARLSGKPRLPRLSRSHDLPPPALGQRRQRV